MDSKGERFLGKEKIVKCHISAKKVIAIKTFIALNNMDDPVNT